MAKMRNFLFFSVIFILVISSCRKEKIITEGSANIELSTDTIFFDTVFTTIGSSTKYFKIKNPHNQTIEISKIYLSGANAKMFRLNIDGSPGNSFSNILIKKKDSLFGFIEVTVDPNNVNSPMVVEAQIIFETNSNISDIDLVAWGQDAIYYTPKVYSQTLPPYSCLDGDCNPSLPPVNITWTNTKPYVVYGYLVIDSLDQLTIDKGVRVHFHNNSGLWVYKDGSLTINGTQAEPVTFQGDRLEQKYKDIPGQWDRVWINEGANNVVLNYLEIKNAFIGIQAETLPFYPSTPISSNVLLVNNCKIDNCSGVGFFGRNFQAQINNTIISRCGQYGVALSGGGNYEFNHATIANYWTASSRETPNVFLQNSYTDVNGATQVRSIGQADFNNCIIDGRNDDNFEFQIDLLSPGTINYKFDHCIMRTNENTTDGSKFINIIKNPTAIIFSDSTDFDLASSSPAINVGDASHIANNPSILSLDRKGKTRNTPPDLGAIEN